MTYAPSPIEMPTRSKVLLCSSDLSGLSLCSNVTAFCPDCDVYLLTDPKQILSTLHSDNYDIFLLDIDASHCEAVNVLQQVRECFVEELLPIVLLSSLEELDDDTLMNATDLIHKPLRAYEVKLRIRNALTLRRCFEANHAIQERLEHEVSSRTKKLNMLIDSGLMILIMLKS